MKIDVYTVLDYHWLMEPAITIHELQKPPKLLLSMYWPDYYRPWAMFGESIWWHTYHSEMISQPIKLQQTTTLSPGLQPQTFKYVFRLSSTQANESNYDDQMCPEDSEAFYNVMIY